MELGAVQGARLLRVLHLPRLRLPSSRRAWGVVAGYGALIAAQAVVLTTRPSLVAVGLAAVATALLALSPRLGSLGAALLVVVAVPFGRAADVDLVRLAGLPVRAQDAAIGVGVLLAAAAALPRLLAARRTPLRSLRDPVLLGPLVVLVLYIALGAFAFGLGVGRHNALRDIARDARWWILYGAIAVALVSGTRWPQLVRGLLYGAIAFSLLLLATAIAPKIGGGLRAQAMTYDWGAMRLQFSNHSFVLAALAYSGWRAIAGRRPFDVACVGLFASAVVFSQTRTTLFLVLATLGLLVLTVAIRSIRRHRIRTAALGGAAGAGALAAGAAIAFAVLLALPNGVTLPAPAKVAPPPKQTTTTKPPPTVVDRITFQGEDSGVDAIENGRFDAYRKAAAAIGRSPVAGLGLGSLVPLGRTFGNTRPATAGFAPGVDDAYLTVALKVGLIGVPIFALLMLLPMLGLWRSSARRLAAWYVPAWLGLMGLTVTQSYATSGYGPFALALLLAIPLVGRRSLARRPTLVPARPASAEG